jgi:hypothetical protein
MASVLRLSGRGVCVVVASLAMLLGGSTAARADLLAYEGFDYDAGAGLVGLDGGIGFDGAWGSVTMQDVGISDAIVAGSMTYIDGSGNELVTTGNKLLNSGALDTGLTGRRLDFRRDDSTGSETWFSMLGIRLGETPVRGANFTFFDSTHAITAGGADGASEKLNIGENSGVDFDPGTGVVEDRWFVRAPQVSPNPWLPEDEPPTAEAGGNVRDVFTEVLFTEQAFFVMRIDHIAEAPDQVYFWLNPDLGTMPSDENASGYFLPEEIQAAADAVAGVPYTEEPNGGEFSLDLIRLFAGNDTGAGAGPGEWHLDELRLGETYADVTPIVSAGTQGDYNDDGVVNAADYVAWRNAVDSGGTLANEGDNPGTVDQGDYDFWAANYGNGLEGSGSTAAVPEPTAAMLMLLATLALVGRRRR